MEAKSKGECIELAIDHLLKLEECCADAVGWLEKSKAFVPDESKAVQELKAALAKSIEREQALLAYVTSLTSVIAKAGSHLDEMRSISRAPIAVEGDQLPTLHHPSPHLDQEKFKHTGTFPVAEEDQARQGLNNQVEACCSNFEECNKPCVPRAEHWKWRAKEAEKPGMDSKWNMQWVIPDVTCNAEPVKPRPLL